jgi:hypothetical protein
MYKAWRVGDPDDAAAMIVQKLIAPGPQRTRDERDAPFAVSPDNNPGSEADLETRIDEQPLPSDAALVDSVAAVRALIANPGARAVLLVQSSTPATGTFVEMPAVIVLDSGRDWDRDAIRTALTNAAGSLWTTSQLGARWAADTSGPQAIERLNGLGALAFANRGPLLFLSNDARLLASVLSRAGSTPPARSLTYAAGFRHAREQSNYERVMRALDFTSPAANNTAALERSGVPAFFSGNIASLSRVLSNLTEVRVTQEEGINVTLETVLYQMGN